MLKGKCKKWVQKYEIAFEGLCLHTFFGEMNTTNIAAKKLVVISTLVCAEFLYLVYKEQLVKHVFLGIKQIFKVSEVDFVQ